MISRPIPASMRSAAVEARCSSLGVIMREHVQLLVERIVAQVATGAPSQQVHQLVLRDCVHPRRQRLSKIVGMALVMYGE